MNTHSDQSGRSLLEIIGVLGILAVITIGGLIMFKLTSASAISKNLLDAAVQLAVLRHNTLLAPLADNPHQANKISKMGPNNTPMSVENGVGSTDDIFWVTIGSSDHLIAQPVCQELLRKADGLKQTKLGFIGIALDDTIVEQCDRDGVVKMLFQKAAAEKGSGTNHKLPYITPIIPSGEECPKRLCPTGAVCEDSQIVSCAAGYHMINCGTCAISCEKCPAGTYTPTQTTSCDYCLPCDQPTQKINESQTQCKQLSKGQKCPGGGFVNEDGTDCIQCLKDADCTGEYICAPDNVCRKVCPDGTYSNDTGDCRECTNDDDCDWCYSCANDTWKCEEDNWRTPPNGKCSGGTISCNAGYYEGNQNCQKCSANKTSPEGAQSASDCYCPDNHYLTDSGDCIACAEGATSTGPNATACVCTDTTKQWIKNTNKCDIKCGDNAAPIDGVCWCNAGYWGNGQTCTQCSKDFSSTPGENRTQDTCYCPDGYFLPFPDDEPTECWSCANIDGLGSTDPKNATACICPENYYWDSEYTFCNNCNQNLVSNQGSTKESDCYCPDDYYLKNPNSKDSCIPCGGGTSHGPDATTCTCDENYWWDELNKYCFQCPEGATAAPGSTSCICPDNYYWNSGYCDLCPNEMTSNGVVCLCPANNYWNANFGTCSACPNGRKGPVGATSADECCAADQVLDPDTNTCVSCLTDGDCADDMTCNNETKTCECPSEGKWVTLSDGSNACIVLETHTLGTGSYTKTLLLTKNTQDSYPRGYYSYDDAAAICAAYGKSLFWDLDLHRVISDTRTTWPPSKWIVSSDNTYPTSSNACVEAIWSPTLAIMDDNKPHACCFHDENNRNQWVKDLYDLSDGYLFWTGAKCSSGALAMYVYCSNWTQETYMDTHWCYFDAIKESSIQDKRYPVICRNY